MAQQLGVNSDQVKSQAAKLELSFPRPGCRKAPSDRYRPQHKRARVIDPEKLARYRKVWLTTRETYPQAGITFLQKQVRVVYRWLSKYDAEWLQEHKPALKPRCPPSSQVRADWEKRDAQLAKAVEAAAFALKGLPGSPIRITRVAIARVMGQPYQVLTGTALEKLPLTKKALTSSLEGIEAFAVRRIKWTASLYQREHLQPTKTGLLKRAGVWNARKSPCVQQASENALCMLSG